MDFLKKCLLSAEPFELKPAEVWSDDKWANDQEKRNFVNNEGYWTINEGKARGTIIGGNQCTFNLLHGTEFMPNIDDSVLFLEDDDEAHVATIDRDLQSIIHQPGFNGVRGIVIGRFQPKTGMTKELLTKIIKSKSELKNVPIIANVDFGHTTPIITFPIGGVVEIEVSANNFSIRIVEH